MAQPEPFMAHQSTQRESKSIVPDLILLGVIAAASVPGFMNVADKIQELYARQSQTPAGIAARADITQTLYSQNQK
jgi:hypothetical protein